jgi:hypothetical protein
MSARALKPLAALGHHAETIEQEPESVADVAVLLAGLRVEVAGYIVGAPGLDGLRAQQGQL